MRVGWECSIPRVTRLVGVTDVRNAIHVAILIRISFTIVWHTIGVAVIAFKLAIIKDAVLVAVLRKDAAEVGITVIRDTVAVVVRVTSIGHTVAIAIGLTVIKDAVLIAIGLKDAA